MDGQLSLTTFDLPVSEKQKKAVKPKPQKPPEKIYAVDEFIDLINSVFKPMEYIVQGEISRVQERGGAVYFTVINKEKTAALDCLIWRSKLASYGIALKDGLEVKIVGSPNLYKPSGRFSFMANYITPIGEGALKQAFEQLKKKLTEQGYFATERKRKLPAYVSSIGLITSENADARRDFMTHLGNLGAKIYFYDVRVEGVKAVDSVVEAIRWFNENTKDIQVLVVTRGGGSLESLQAFNSEEVAKAIYSSRIPVISAIGHERDVTISDLVADVRASTPTDAGKILSEDWRQVNLRMNEIEKYIYGSFKLQCNDVKNQITNIQQNMVSSYKKCIDQHLQKIHYIDRSLSACFHDVLRRFKHITERFFFCFSQYTNRTQKAIKEIDSMEMYLYDVSSRWYKAVHKHIDNHEKTLSLCDPDLKLKQGYSITFNKDRKVVKSTKLIAVNEIVTIKLHTGEIVAQVDSLKSS